MKPRIRLAAALLAAFLPGAMVAACGKLDNVVEGGSAVEGETVTARLVDAQGSPLAGLRVHAVVDAPTSWSRDLVTDTAGTIVVTPPAPANLLLLSLEPPSTPGQILTFRIPLRRHLDTTLTLERWGTLSGTAVVPEGWTARAVLCTGLDLRAGVVDGRFSMHHVPPGSWPFTIEADSAGILDTFVLGDVTMPAGGSDVALQLVPRSTATIAAFDENTLPPQCIQEATAQTFAIGYDCASLATGTSGWSGSSLRVHLPGIPERAATLPIPVPSDTSGPRTLGASDTLAFMARGSGLVRIHLEFGDSIPGDPARSDTLLLPADWTRERIPARILLPPGKDDVALQKILVSSNEDAWVVLDDVTLIPGR